MQLSSGKPGGGTPAPLAAALAADPSGPLLTYYDDASGERTELSAAALANWVTKTANLLADECALGPGDRAAVLLPPHWQTAAVLLGAWTAGLSVDTPGPVPPGAAAGQPPAGPPDVTFASLDRRADLASAGHRFVLGLHPLGVPLATVPDGCLDYIAEVRGQPDQLVLPHAPDGDYERWRAAGEAAGEAAGVRAGDRLLVDAARFDHPTHWLLAPLAAGASIVLCVNLDPDRVADRVATERVTRQL